MAVYRIAYMNITEVSATVRFIRRKEPKLYCVLPTAVQVFNGELAQFCSFSKSLFLFIRPTSS